MQPEGDTAEVGRETREPRGEDGSTPKRNSISPSDVDSLHQTAVPAAHSSQLPLIPTVASVPWRPKGRDAVLSTLDIIIQGSNLAKDTCGTPPAQVVFGSVGVLLTIIRVLSLVFCRDELPARVAQDFTANKQDHADLGVSCTDVRRALDRGLDG